ncbi:MAG TPA: multicopper oxidase domain-containing protein [Geothermobacteraceae bacterium]|nr:multicopper oxidase domain-containing protein [Geothermobacteraceae bacterium]
MKILQRRILALFIAITVGVVFGAFSAALAAVPGGTLDPTTVPKYVTPLVIPPVMPATGITGDTPQADLDIAVRQFKQQILPGGIWDNLGGTSNNYPPTTVWSYGSASDPMPDSSALGGGLGVAPAANSSFNYPAFTVENVSGVMNKVRWRNELVEDPVACFYGSPTGTSCNYLTHLLPVDQTLHWANPSNADCYDHMTGTFHSGTDCETLNQLPYLGPVPIVTHVHGAHVNPESDGYPEAWWLPNASNIPGTYATGGTRFGQWTGDGPNSVAGSAFFAYENTQEPTTIWYHDHSMGMTRLNVYAGPAGFWLVRELGLQDTVQDYNGGTPTAGSLPWPPPLAGDSVVDLNASALRDTIREIPVVIQDRSFDWVDAAGNPVPQGSPDAVGTELWYPSDRVDFDGYAGPTLGSPLDADADISKIWNPEAFFNTMVVNGVTWPSLAVEPEQYRLRLLNGCNSRTLNLSMFVVTPGTDTQYGTADDVITATEVPFYQIGGDQGFLPYVTEVVKGSMTQLRPGQASVVQSTPADQALLMMPAERADVILDFSGFADNTHIRILNTAGDGPFNGDLGPANAADPVTTGQVMEFVVKDTAATGLPSTAVTDLMLPADTPLGPADNAASPRKLSLNEMISDTVCVAINGVTEEIQYLFTDPNLVTDPAVLADCEAQGAALGGDWAGEPAGPRQALLGDITDDGFGNYTAVPQRWMDPISTNPVLGSTEIWEVYNTTMDAHPIHVHLVRFEIVEREDLTFNPDGSMTHTGVTYTPELNELGFKDTVVAYPGQVTRLKAHFDILGLYVWHCHIVEHEDNEMMLPFEVVPGQAAAPASISVPATSSTGSYQVSWADSATVGATYTLQESTDPTFATGVTETLNAVSPVSIAGKTNGTYYYRVKAVKPPIADSAWMVGGNGCVVTVVPATMVSPADTSTLAGASQTFTWTDVGASNYVLHFGTTPGGSDIIVIYPSPSTATSTTVGGLPVDGSTVYVRLWSEIGGVWYFNDYSYTAANPVITPSAMVTPADTSTLAGSSQTFTWTDAGTSNYVLHLGTTPGASDIIVIYPTPSTATSTTVGGLPVDGSTVYVRLWSEIGGVWYFNDYSYTAANPVTPSAMVSPADTSTLAGSSQTFTWTDAGASNYVLHFGTTPGASDIIVIYPTPSTATTTTVGGLPVDGNMVYVRLWSEIGGVWYSNDYTYTAFGP